MDLLSWVTILRFYSGIPVNSQWYKLQTCVKAKEYLDSVLLANIPNSTEQLVVKVCKRTICRKCRNSLMQRLQPVLAKMAPNHYGTKHRKKMELLTVRCKVEWCHQLTTGFSLDVPSISNCSKSIKKRVRDYPRDNAVGTPGLALLKRGGKSLVISLKNDSSFCLKHLCFDKYFLIVVFSNSIRTSTSHACTSLLYCHHIFLS